MQIRTLPKISFMKTIFWLIAVCFGFVKAGTACDFKYDPATAPRFYREAGWVLPGIADDDPDLKANLYGLPRLDVLRQVAGLNMYVLRRDQNHYAIRFPEQLFSLGEQHNRMRSILAKAIIIRWDINGKTIAYTYGLIPIEKAYEKNGEWVYEGEVGCIFYGTFIDDRGDGVFQTLVPETLTADLIPAWAKQP